jgi:two-component system LytT family sensor kinase
MINRNLRYLSIVEKRVLFILTGILSGATIGLLVYYNLTGFFPPVIPFTLLFLGSGLLGLGIQYLLTRTSNLINNRVSWQRQFNLRFGLEIIINSIIASSLGGLSLLLVLKLVSGNNYDDIWSTYWQSFLILWILSLVFVLIYSIIKLLFFAQLHYAEGQIDELKAERKQIKLQFEALKSQLSPHYLFNSLNTISSLLYHDKTAAEDFIRRLAETYQYILNTHQKQLVTLDEELNFVQAYYYLLCVRYKEGLRLQINIPDHLRSAQIPPMTLQILVENAIKHNTFSIDQPLHIELNARDDSVVHVINNKTQQPVNVRSNKIGLKNIALRYQYLTSNKIEVLDKDNFEVAVPIVNTNNSEAA